MQRKYLSVFLQSKSFLERPVTTHPTFESSIQQAVTGDLSGILFPAISGKKEK